MVRNTYYQDENDFEDFEDFENFYGIESNTEEEEPQELDFNNSKKRLLKNYSIEEETQD